jgi:deoxycytidine triphosphate deaminase
MLSGQEIKAAALIQGAEESNYRAASYDLRVGRIIAPSGTGLFEGEEFIIPPQGMIEVISAERVKLPKDIAGYTTLKNRLCNKGVLAISIGIVDPLYEGLMSSTLINFSRSAVPLRAGDTFLRLTFHRYRPESEVIVPIMLADQDYIADRRKKAEVHFSDTFLNLRETIAKVSAPVMQQVLGRWKKAFFVYVPIAAFALALMAFFITVGAFYTGRAMLNREQIKWELRREMQDEDYKQLKAEVEKILATQPTTKRRATK